MANLTKRKFTKLGSPPGTLIYTGKFVQSKAHIDLINYSKDSLKEIKDATLDECQLQMKGPHQTWINVRGISDTKTISEIGTSFKINPLVMEDILHTKQRPKSDDYKEYLYIVLRVFKKRKGDKLEDTQLSLILGKNYLISFVEGDEDIFEPIRERLRKEGSRMKTFGVDYLAYAILDMTIDHTFGMLEQFDDELEKLENHLFLSSSPQTIKTLLTAKRSLATMKKSIWPLREVISGLERKENPLISQKTRFFLHDVHDHTIQMIETIEGFRDILSGIHDIYLTNINLRLNEIMKFLTIVSTIFVPLTFIASIYGMNFQFMPELGYIYGYPAILAIMLVLAIAMLSLFKFKKWI